jgi:hypothetical protein
MSRLTAVQQTCYDSIPLALQVTTSLPYISVNFYVWLFIGHGPWQCAASKVITFYNILEDCIY